jgi:hypothetical protein
MIDEDAKDSDPEWSIGKCLRVISNSSLDTYSHLAFKKYCTAHCIAKDYEAISESNYERANELYLTGIGLDSSCESLFAHRSKANLEQH